MIGCESMAAEVVVLVCIKNLQLEAECYYPNTTLKLQNHFFGKSRIFEFKILVYLSKVPTKIFLISNFVQCTFVTSELIVTIKQNTRPR